MFYRVDMTSAHEQHPDLTLAPLATPDPVIDLDDALLETEDWDADPGSDADSDSGSDAGETGGSTGDYDLAERHALRRVAGLST